MTRDGAPLNVRILALEAEIRELRSQLRADRAEAERNEQVYRRTQEREVELLRTETLPQLLEAAVGGLARSYALDAVSLVLQDPQHEIRHLLLGDGHSPDDFPGVRFADGLAGIVPSLSQGARPSLGPFLAPDHQLVLPSHDGLQSVAIVPLTRADRLIGVLAFGSVDPTRFTRHHATDFLAHLGATLALCIEGACNRARLMRAGLTDYLTGWHNKRYLHSRLKAELARAQRQASSVALLMIDLDHFKAINDECGHLAGDQAIREVALRIESQVRASDAAARFGGDEFAVLLPGTTLEDAGRLAQRIRQAVSGSNVELGRVHRRLTLSIGAAAVSPKPGNIDLKSLSEQLLAEADAALYRAKAAGRDRHELQGG